MKSVMFTFDEKASEDDQEQMRREILELPGVHDVGRISPEAQKAALRRMWYAQVADEATADDLVTRLRQHRDIRTADLPPARKLV